MSATAKLTKKQKKGLAFRQRKGKKELENANGDVPVMESQDLEEQDAVSDVVQADATGSSKGKKEIIREEHNLEGKDTARAEPSGSGKKRKRDKVNASKEAEGDRPTKKKKEDSLRGDGETADTPAGLTDSNSKTKNKTRFILFVGNLKYTTSKETIQEHFSKCDPPPTIRMLTPKSKTTSKSKGCAFLEFTHRNALQQALKLHQSELEGRKINVELTAGGGGKSEARLTKVKERNRGLGVQRKNILKKRTIGGDDTLIEPERPQRHSKTSGIEAAPPKKRTWTVGDGDDSTTHRGGQKKLRSSKDRIRRQKDWGTGVNSIPVG